MLAAPPDFCPPRLVLISSRMPWCQSMANAVRRDGRILYIVYDFDSWTFKDILRECKAQLDHFRPGSKALSVMMLSKGGPGYFYLLKSFVMTPQKLKRAQYRCMRE
ncbi:hypothetical protein EGW08_005016 [Elysia chlorotica]|uniref:Uncharacterized protein n=1 Tax=Elysia chlorotica TaxID=188477 RepID=A0A3S1BMM8_ELYCH|nr:hypothetical protein EGW08_005016 [Elysia chlorotica]